MTHSRVVLSAVGDIMLGDSPPVTGWGFLSRQAGHDAVRRLEQLDAHFDCSDVVFGNLETVLASESCGEHPLQSRQMRGSPELAYGLAEAGFTVLNVANNHAMQHGQPAFLNTVQLLRSVGIEVCGLRGKSPWSSTPARVDRGGLRFGFLGYCLRPRQYGSSPPLYAVGEEASMCADIRRLVQEVEHVVISVHWGEEFVTEPSEVEVSLARTLLGAGATLILGHHPHVLRPVESGDGRLIAYSLGNYISDMIWQDRLRESMILDCGIGVDGVVSVRARAFRIREDFYPTRGEWNFNHIPIRGLSEVSGLSDASYRRAAKQELKSFRTALYRHALANLWRYPPEILIKLVRTTLGNKVRGFLTDDES